MMRQAVTTGIGTVSVIRSSEPTEPSTQEVTVAPELVGVCGSDAHVFDGSHTYLNYPIVQGHEFVGRVTAVGSGVGHLRPGDRVVVDPIVACGTCSPCRRDRANCCTDLRVLGIHQRGGLAELLKVDATSAFPIGTLPSEAAIFVEPLAVAMHCIERASLTSDDTLVIMGAGSLGRATIIAAKARGARVLVCDRSAERRKLAGSFGAATSSLSGARAAISAYTSGEGPVAIVDTTGAPALLRLAVDEVAHGGTVVAVGISQLDFRIPVAILSRKEVTIAGSRNSLRNFPAAINLAERFSTELIASVTHRFDLDQAQVALELASSRAHTGKIVIRHGTVERG